MEMLFSPSLFVIGGGVSKKADKFLPTCDVDTPWSRRAAQHGRHRRRRDAGPGGVGGAVARVILERLHVEPHRRLPRSRWPFSVPAIAQLADEGLELRAPVTFLVGENGSGKSTLVEAAAECFDLDAQGGRANRKYASDRPPCSAG